MGIIMKKFQQILITALLYPMIYSCSSSMPTEITPKVVVENYCNVSFACEIENNSSPNKKILLIFNNSNNDSIIIENPTCTGIIQLRLFKMDSSRIFEKYIYKPGPGCNEGRIIIPPGSTKVISLNDYLDELYDLTNGREYILECNYSGIVYDIGKKCKTPDNIVIRAKSQVIKYSFAELNR